MSEEKATIEALENENSLLIESNQDQNREIMDLKEDLAKVKRRVHRTQAKLRWENLWVAPAVFLVVLAGLFLSLYPLYMIWTAPNRPTHCYIQSMANRDPGTPHWLFSSIPWHADLLHGQFATLEEAVQAADLLHCPLSPTED
jgi:hypothetical protein